MMEPHKPLVSVGLPIYNRPEGLRRTLECFINQTYKNIEIIIADNCSPDSEVEKIAREYASKDDRISYYRHDKNKGWGFNTNFVIDKAQGDYFLRATDDDWWDKDFIREIMKGMISGEFIMGFCDFIAVDETGKKGQHYPDFFPLLNQYSFRNSNNKLSNYINQFEGFGKSNLYFSIFKTQILRSKYVKETLDSEVLAGDLLINFFCLSKGELYLVNKILFKVTFGNEKLYDEGLKSNNKSKRFFLIELNLFKCINTVKRWRTYFTRLNKIIDNSEIYFFKKKRLKAIVFKRKLMLYYDSFLANIRVRGFDLFKLIRRKYYLE